MADAHPSCTDLRTGRSRATDALHRALVLTYGGVVYTIFLATFLYLVGWIAGAVVPRTIDSGGGGDASFALLVNGLLLGLFAAQHTVMARPAFKRWWTQFVPEAVERTTFVLATCATLGLMVWQWRALPQVVWQIEGPGALLLHALYLGGFGIVLVSTFLIDHFELFGLKQAFYAARGLPVPTAAFRERLFYRWVRHPVMLGFLIAFWAAPVMTQGRLFFALLTTSYILLALFIEERTLVALHGGAYREYQRRVPKLLPRLRSGA
jgi:protein-S-isoprenylcysteine O-methyltransferase Ste14